MEIKNEMNFGNNIKSQDNPTKKLNAASVRNKIEQNKKQTLLNSNKTSDQINNMTNHKIDNDELNKSGDLTDKTSSSCKDNFNGELKVSQDVLHKTNSNNKINANVFSLSSTEQLKEHNGDKTNNLENNDKHEQQKETVVAFSKNDNNKDVSKA
jgi:hypothetical protein